MTKPHATKYLSVSALAVFLLIVAVGASGRSYVGGVLYTRDGKRIEVQQFLDPLKIDNYFIGESEGKQVKVPIGKLKEFTLLTADVNYMFPHSKLVPETGMASLVFRDGRAVIFTSAYFEKGTLTFVVLNEKGKREERRINFRNLLKIEFESTVGTVRMCPLDKLVFPDDFVFCPYDGTRLIWWSPKP